MTTGTKVGPKTAVTIHYTVKDDAGEVLDTTEGRDPMTYLHGADNVVPGLEAALEGKGPGAKVEATLTPEQGYGQRDESKVRNVPIRRFADEKIRIGGRHRVAVETGWIVAYVKEIKGDYALIDGNHPLAGKTLHFQVEVTAVRDATEQELAHGHAHGPGGAH
jgi:FKBP-type peptidyl-prolyl cis-trans isomerase SlyD